MYIVVSVGLVQLLLDIVRGFSKGNRELVELQKDLYRNIENHRSVVSVLEDDKKTDCEAIERLKQEKAQISTGSGKIWKT